MALVRRFDGEWPDRFANEIFEYLTMNEKEFPEAHRAFDHPEMNRDRFMALADQFRSPHLWRKDGDEWVQRYAVWHDD